MLVGALLPGANAFLFVAERHVATGLSALIIGAVPLWIVVLRAATGDRPPRAAIAGVLVGFAGLALLVRPSGGAPLWALLLVVRSSVLWARLVPLGPAAAAARLVRRDRARDARRRRDPASGRRCSTTHPHFGAISARSAVGWVYLVTFGSIVGYTAYVWLLDNAPIGQVATYAYVNPVVAITLGATCCTSR